MVALLKEVVADGLMNAQLSFDDISDKISIRPEEEDGTNLEELIGGLED